MDALRRAKALMAGVPHVELEDAQADRDVVGQVTALGLISIAETLEEMLPILRRIQNQTLPK